MPSSAKETPLSEFDDLPVLLYKYLPIDGNRAEYTRRSVLHREVYFAPRWLFADPNDCRPEVSVDGTAEEYRAMFERLVRADPQISEAHRDRLIADLMEQYFPPDRIDRNQFEADLKNELDSVGILCLCESGSCPEMWESYANESTGICIGYRLAAHVFADMAGYGVYRVLYREEKATVRVVEGSIEAARAMVSTKSPDYSHEREWRMLNYNGFGVHRLRDQFIDRIIVGAAADDAVLGQVSEWVKGYRRFRPAILKAQTTEGGDILLREVVPGIGVAR